MKRRDLVKLLERNGWRCIRKGGNHDVFAKDDKMEPVPRHREIPEALAQAIIRRQGLQ